jgi:hypothetical protein
VRRGIGVALIVLLLALATVLLLSARRSAEVVGAAGEALEGIEPSAESDAGEVVPGAGELPGLDEMKRATGQHADEVRKALEEADN